MYGAIVVDPPWAYEGMTAPWRSDSDPDYALMSLDAIKALPVPTLATPTAHLYLWAVLPMMAEAFDVVRGWGFRPSVTLTWCKPGPGLGGGFRGNTEHLIVARRGSPSNTNPTCAACGGRVRGAFKCVCARPEWRHKGRPVPPMEVSFSGVGDGTWFCAPRGAHSAKPDLFMDLVEGMSPGPYLEMFARRDRLGWDTWGNECLGTAQMAA
jgi:N6-adenosine-specific RNA methylase IME4